MSKTGTIGWEVTELPQVCYFQEGPGLRRWQYTENGFPFINIRCIQNNQIDHSNVQYISVEEANLKYKHFQLDEGDLVMSSSGTLGRMAKVKAIDLPIMLNTSVIRFRSTNEERLSSDFLPHYLLGKEFLDQITAESQGSAQVNFGPTHLKLVVCTLPPLPEQQKIAAILTSVDDVIESTQAQINKLKDLKTGMMQELLTKGIGHSEFKDSPVGRIPKAWDCVLLDKVARRGSGHTPDKQTKEYWNGGIKWVSLADSSKLDKLHISETENEISSDGIKNSSAVLHPKGTVVLSRDAGIGKSAVTTDAMAVSQHFMAWICGEKLNNYFLYYLLQMWKPRFENIAMGSTIKTIGLQYFKTLEIPLPEISEQIKIAESFLSLDDSIFKAERKRNHLTNIKKALMQDLLTGKVRVKVS